MDDENISDNQSTEIMDVENISDNQPTEKMDSTTVNEEMTINNKDYKEYEDEMDTSDEEDIRNTVGNIPMNWYDEYSHIGYDWDGAKIVKPERGDQLDNFMEKMENPDFWRTVRDLQTGQDVVLSDKDVELIQRIESSKIPDSTYEEYGPWIEWFTSEVMDMPIRNGADHKRSFIASRSEAARVERYARLIRAGLLKTREQKRREREKKRQRSFFMMWSTDDAEDESMRRITDHIPAPKRNLPSHAESYNPPPEFLFNEREMRIWNKQEETPWKRKLHYVPQKYNSLRQVPAYPKFIKERFTRCLDLYLCPRARKMRLTIEPEDLLPKLPSPKDLQPFPTIQSLVYNGHTDMVRCISIDPLGQYLLSGSDDMTVKIWEISTARCMKTIPVGGIVRGVEWNPNKALSMIAVIADRKLLIINPGIGDHLVVSKTDSILSTPPIQTSIVSDKIKAIVQWDDPTTEEYENGIRIVLNHFKELKQVTWHGRGDYCATVMPDGANRSVLIHQMSTRRSQLPFAKSKGLVQSVLFHPIRPFLFVATQKNIRIYDLVKQELFKKLMSYAKWISSMAIHPGGDNLIVGTYDRKMLWFDLDLSTKPYKTLRLHSTAIRSVAFHKRYPLFASGSDDRALIISHGMVYNDLLQNPLVVPLKMLKEHEDFSDFGIFGVTFHPTEPWVFSCGADKTIRLFT